MYEKLEVCPVCKHTDFNNYMITTDYSISGESFALNRCGKCQLIFTNPRPDAFSLPRYYQSDAYISHTDKSNSLINFIYKLVRLYTTNQKINLIRKSTNGKRLLDFGCGTGDFLKACQHKGFTPFGYEPNEQARTIAQGKGVTTIDDLSTHSQKFDVITAWHVIEHVSELRKTIKLLKKKLTDDGILIIAVPNINSYDATYYGEYWAALDVPRHLYHFTQDTIGKLFEKSKLNLISTIPMYFDAFYVSMLSEKYKGKKGSFMNALKVAFRSNRKARQSGEYSSLIYLLKK